VAGNPEEYFWDDALPAWYKRWEISTFAAFLERMLVEGTTPNGVFGVKVFAGDYLEDFLKHVRKLPQYSDLRLSVPALMSGIFPNLRCVWLTRRDKVRQAVSWWIAFQTRVWAVRNRNEERATLQVLQSVRNLEAPQIRRQEPGYSFEKIDSLVQEIVRREAEWQKYFTEGGIKPLTVVYEDFAQCDEATTLQILLYLGIDVPRNLGSRKRILQKQADVFSEEFVRRYLEEKKTGWEPTWHTQGVL
jgi:trehalose 2-sulfotransferase